VTVLPANAEAYAGEYDRLARILSTAWRERRNWPAALERQVCEAITTGELPAMREAEFALAGRAAVAVLRGTGRARP